MKPLYLSLMAGFAILVAGCAAPSSDSSSVSTPTPTRVPTEKTTELKRTVPDTQKQAAVPTSVVKEVAKVVSTPVQEIVKAVPTPSVQDEAEEVFTEAETAAYEAEQKAAQEAQVARQKALAEQTFQTVATGNFSAASGKKISGGVTIEEKGDEVMITLSDDFSVSKGPDLYVTLSQQQSFTGSKNVALEESKVKILDALANTKGKQVYTISKSEFEKYDYGVTIWCKKYNILFGATPLSSVPQPEASLPTTNPTTAQPSSAVVKDVDYGPILSTAHNGYDLVSYFSGNPSKGRDDFHVTHEGVTYYFASQANRDLFYATPDRYKPQYGGWCAYAFGKGGGRVEVDPETFKITDGKLYLFYNGIYGNTLKSWNEEGEAQLTINADKRWAEIANDGEGKIFVQ